MFYKLELLMEHSEFLLDRFYILLKLHRTADFNEDKFIFV